MTRCRLGKTGAREMCRCSLECRRISRAAFNALPGVREARAKYHATPTVKAKKLAYEARPDTIAKTKVRFAKYYIRYKQEAIAYALKKKYGLTLEQRDQLIIRQKHRCPVCAISYGPKRPRLACVDHAHDGTNRIRGILCNRCNLILGQVQDSVAVLQGLISYLTCEENSVRMMGLPIITGPQASA